MRPSARHLYPPAAHGLSGCFLAWMGLLVLGMGLGALCYLGLLDFGQVESGLSRDVSWGFHIGQFTYLVGVAASSVVLLLPTYFHGYQRFGKLLLLGELITITVVIMSLLFIVVDLGQPQRLLNLILHPSPRSPMFWDMVTLFGYLSLCVIITSVTLDIRYFKVIPPGWLKPLILVSILWGCAIHTVSAFIYAGLAGRDYWLTAILAARFLASAFCSGPAIMLLIAFFLNYKTGFKPGKRAVQSLTLIIAYAMGCNIFFYLLELFTALYSGIPSHIHPFALLFAPPWSSWQSALMWTAAVLGPVSFLLLAFPQSRNSRRLLQASLLMLVVATWIDKGPILMSAGFAPNPFGRITPYTPTLPELGVGLGVYAFGAFFISLLIRMLMPRLDKD